MDVRETDLPRTGLASRQSLRSWIVSLKVTEKILPSVPLRIESAFTLDPRALQLRRYAVRSWYYGRELQDLSHGRPGHCTSDGTHARSSSPVFIALDRSVEGLEQTRLVWVQAKASPTNGNFLNSSQSSPSSRFSEYKDHDVFPHVVVCLAMYCKFLSGRLSLP